LGEACRRTDNFVKRFVDGISKIIDTPVEKDVAGHDLVVDAFTR